MRNANGMVNTGPISITWISSLRLTITTTMHKAASTNWSKMRWTLMASLRQGKVAYGPQHTKEAEHEEVIQAASCRLLCACNECFSTGMDLSGTNCASS